MQEPKHTHPAICPSCTTTALARNHYFTGKLMVERDFTDEQRYFMERLRLHNQRLHGAGVACGLQLRQHDNPACQDRYVILGPGSAIDCCGHDILVADDDTIDLRAFPAVQALFDKPDDKDHVLQFAICYRECPTEEIPVLYDECGCDDSQCAPNRILESYRIEVKVDPPPVVADVEMPSLLRRGTIGIARAAAVAVDEKGGRVFVLAGGANSAIYQVSATTQAVETPLSLGRQAFAMAIAPDGMTLYAVVAGSSAAADTELWIFDVSGPTTLAGGAKHPAPITGSGSSAPVLAMMTTGELLAGYPGGKVYAWKAGDPANKPSASITIAGAKITGLVGSSDGNRAWVCSLGSADLQSLDLTVAGLNPQTLTVPGTDVYKLALASSTGPDLLVAGDKTNAKLHLVDPAKPSGTPPLGSIALAAAPVDLVVSPGGAWVYVDETTDAVQVVDLHRLAQGLPTAPTPPFAVGPGTAGIVISATGQRLYVPYAGAAPDGSDGGAAVIDVEDTDCCDALREVRPCPDCHSADCVIVATVRGYRPGRKLLDPADPAPTADDDVKNNITRIDNLDGRKILARTQALEDAIKCLCDHGAAGVPGPQGPPGQSGSKGDAGDTGPAGPGLDTGIPRITALSWKHGTDGNQLTPIKRLRADAGHGIVIAFSHAIEIVGDSGKGTTLDASNRRNVFSTELLERTTQDRPVMLCRCAVDGVVIPVDPAFAAGDEKLIVGATERPGFPATAMAFVFPAQVEPRNAQEVMVFLRGQFVVDHDGNSVDASFVRARLPTGDRRKSTSGVAVPVADPDTLLSIQGTDFESWFVTLDVT